MLNTKFSLLVIMSLFVSLLFVIDSCVMKKEEAPVVIEKPEFRIDLAEIIKKDTLTILAENSTTSYFIYKGKKMGFEYELLQLFAEEIGVNLKVVIVENLDSLINMLDRGEGDIIACNYTVTSERTKTISFSEAILQTHQVLIQRKPEGWEDMEEEDWKLDLITDPSQLAEKEVHVWKNSSYHERLINLSEEIGDTIFIEGVEGNIAGEELIEMVSSGIIDFTISEDNVAKVNERFFDNLYTDLDLSFNQNIAFGLRQNSTILKAKLDEWLIDFKAKSTYKYISRKYFEMPHITHNYKRDHSTLNGSNISAYDVIFKRAGEEIGWDWRLISSVAYQESKFNPKALSFGGAYGMMQFMPNTGPTYGVFPDSPPVTQIMGGARKLQADEKFWKKIPDDFQRKKFCLGSYNAGRGHILDAQRLAEKYGLDPLIWDDNVEAMMLNLSKQKYYQDEVVRNGMIRGTTTYKYVRHVFERYYEWVSVYD